ncbi:YdhK family protein [Saccharibacillus deserti]|uniref:YdhK family protein n=1 Tax=Saccharibacillus deserti TaxID=1634444 RepID=UPI001551A53C|nr:YdhK family protein [Saccharibacillus deserti]
MTAAIRAAFLAAIVLLAGCSQPADEAGGHAMNHSSTGKLPDGLTEAKDAAYPVGTKITVHSDHMAGMDGAEGTVTGAYDTVIYSVSYTPTDGGEPVVGHKWVIREELEDAGDQTPGQGDTVTIEADHMEGMKGAKATIDTASEGVIYQVDYVPTDGGEPVKNHRWVTEDELSAN